MNKKIIIIVIGIILILLVAFMLFNSLYIKPKVQHKIESIGSDTLDKPIIYLYPEKEINIDIKLSNPDDLLCDYPKYDNGWYVKANPSGKLYDLKHKKELYSLYYESKINNKINIIDEGFVVKKDDITNFLNEKLDILGLNYKEKEEFIIYWLPRLQKNEYVYIRFLTPDEINSIQKLEIEPKPDNLIRICMSFKNLDKPIKIKTQELKPMNRSNFTVVEWGGVEIN